MLHTNGKQKKARVTILISDKIDLKIKKITRDKEGHYIMIKESKETQVLNDTLDEIDFIVIFRTFHPNAEEYTSS